MLETLADCLRDVCVTSSVFIVVSRFGRIFSVEKL